MHDTGSYSLMDNLLQARELFASTAHTVDDN
jgi:hypothetical protein